MVHNTGFDCGMEEKLRRKCHAKSVRDRKIHLVGKLSHHVEKLMESVIEPGQGLVSPHALNPPPLLELLAPSCIALERVGEALGFLAA